MPTYVDAGFNVCTPSQLVCALNYNGGGYNCVAEVIQHDRSHLNALISEHDAGIKHLKKLSGRINEFEFARDHKSMKFWSYSGQDVSGVFSYDDDVGALTTRSMLMRSRRV